MPGKTLNQRDFDQLNTEITTGQAPQGVQKIVGVPIFPTSVHYPTIKIEVNSSADIKTVQTWVIESIAKLNNLSPEFVSTAIRFKPRTYFDGPVSVSIIVTPEAAAEK